jgi:hypothetical protein
MGLEAFPQPLLDEQPFEHRLHVVRAPEHALEPRATRPPQDDRQIPLPRSPKPLAVDEQRDARLKDRLADDQLAAAPKLYDGSLDRARRAGSAGW